MELDKDLKAKTELDMKNKENPGTKDNDCKYDSKEETSSNTFSGTNSETETAISVTPKQKIQYFESAALRARRKSTPKFELAIKFICGLLICLIVVLTMILIFMYFQLKKHVLPDQLPEIETKNWMSYRLASFIIPSHYNLFLNPNLTNSLIVGNVSISFMVTKTTDYIIFHVKDLSLNVSVLTGNNENLMITEKHFHERNEQMHIRTEIKLTPNKEYTLQIDFEGKLNKGNDGFYLNKDIDPISKKRYVAVTNFKPTGARKAFPCFDEPAMKASFQLTIVHKNNYNVFFNTEVMSKSPYIDGSSITVFEKTPNISTYHVGFSICEDYAHIENKTDDVNVRIWASKNEIQQGEFALNASIKILSYFNNLFGINYPLTKLDLIAVYNLSGKGTENFGLSVQQAMFFLNFPYASEFDKVKQEKFISMEIAHIIAHQWFGSLVTVAWWDEIWLTEGLTIYFQYFGANYVINNGEMSSEFILHEKSNALATDVFESAQPIHTEITEHVSATDIEREKSHIKFAVIMHMLGNVISNEILLQGVKTILLKHRNRNIKSKDLWNALMKVGSNMNVSEFMSTWIYQKGFPIIKVRKYKNQVVLEQERYMLAYITDKYMKTNDFDKNLKWIIPVTYITSSNKNPQMYWLNKTNGKILVQNDDFWIKLNVDGFGYYRVLYDNKLWVNLKTAFQKNPQIFATTDRTNIIDDSFYIIMTTQVDYMTVSDVVTLLENEIDYLPWKLALPHLKYIYIYVKNKHEKLKELILKLIKRTLKALEEKKDEATHWDKKLIMLLREEASMTYNDTSITNEALKLFREWKVNRKSVPRNLREIVYNAGVKYGSKENWLFCLKKYYKTRSSSEARLLLHAMAQTQDFEQLRIYLSHITENDIPRNVITSIISVLSDNDIFIQEIWMYLRSNFSKFIKMCETSDLMSSFMVAAFSNFDIQSKYNELVSYVPQIKPGNFKKIYVRVLERIHANIRWRKLIAPSIIKGLQDITV